MICIDTMVLGWGVRGAAAVAAPGAVHEDEAEIIDRTRRFFNSLRDVNEVLMVPTPAVAEYLRGFDSDEVRGEQLTALDRYFFLPAFDLPSAALAAELGRQMAARELLRRSDAAAAARIVSDLQILATAIVHGADVLISGDPDTLRTLVDGRLRISAVPRVPTQIALHFDDDDRE